MHTKLACQSFLGCSIHPAYMVNILCINGSKLKNKACRLIEALQLCPTLARVLAVFGLLNI